MSDWNFDILKENIRRHMKERGMKQKDLADALYTSQANIAKHLKKGDDAQTFTLKQVCQLADLFGTSVDELLGREQSERQCTPEEICNFMRIMIETGKLQYMRHVIEDEETWDIDEFDIPIIGYNKRKAEYLAFYFPDYIPIPPCSDPCEYHLYTEEYNASGNRCNENVQINKFLEKFVSIFHDYNLGKHNKEVYSIVVKAYYDDLKKTMERIRSYYKKQATTSKN